MCFLRLFLKNIMHVSLWPQSERYVTTTERKYWGLMTEMTNIRQNFRSHVFRDMLCSWFIGLSLFFLEFCTAAMMPALITYWGNAILIPIILFHTAPTLEDCEKLKTQTRPRALQYDWSSAFSGVMPKALPMPSKFVPWCEQRDFAGLD